MKGSFVTTRLSRGVRVLEWLLIAVILVIAFGSVSYVLPSKLQRQVGKLRLEARRHGLFTSSTSLPDLDAAAEDRVTSGGKVRKHEKLCVVYDLGFEHSVIDVPVWQLTRYQKSQVPIPGWLLRDNTLDGVQLSNTFYWASVAETIAAMPRACRSVVSHANGVRWIGIEQKDAVLRNSFLPELLSSLTALRHLNVSVGGNIDKN